MYHKVVPACFEGAAFGINSDGFFELEKLPQYVLFMFIYTTTDCSCLHSRVQLLQAETPIVTTCSALGMSRLSISCVSILCLFYIQHDDVIIVQHYGTTSLLIKTKKIRQPSADIVRPYAS